MAAPRYTDPKSLDDARELRFQLLDTVFKIRKQMTYPTRISRATGKQMTEEEFAGWRKSAKLTMTHALKDFYRTDAWISRHMLRELTGKLKVIGHDVDLSSDEQQSLIAAEKYLETQQTC